jgi:hypothetical protein
LPRAAEVAGQVLVFPQAGVHVGGQHFAVCVDINTRSFGLSQQMFEVQQIMPGHQDARAGLRAFVNSCRRRSAETPHVGLIQHFHYAQVFAAAFEDHLEQRRYVEVDIRHSGEQGLFDECVDRLVHRTQPPRMMCVGGHAFQTIQQDLLQRLHVGILAAHTHFDASSSVRLLTLIAEHVNAPW